MVKKIINAIICIALLSISSVSSAAVVGYNFSGIVYGGIGGPGPQTIRLNSGDTYSINISWDTSTPSDGPIFYPGAITAISGSAGSYGISGIDDTALTSASLNNIAVLDGFAPSDAIIFNVDFSPLTSAMLGTEFIQHIDLQLSSSSTSATNSNDLPTSLNADDWIGTSFLTVGLANGKSFDASVTEITELTTVPLPPALLLFLTGCAGLVGAVRKRT